MFQARFFNSFYLLILFTGPSLGATSAKPEEKKSLSEGLKGGLKGASRGASRMLQGCFKGPDLREGYRKHEGLEAGFKGASRGLEGGLKGT